MRVVVTITAEINAVSVGAVFGMIGIEEKVAILKTVSIARIFAVHHVNRKRCHLGNLLEKFKQLLQKGAARVKVPAVLKRVPCLLAPKIFVGIERESAL